MLQLPPPIGTSSPCRRPSAFGRSHYHDLIWRHASAHRAAPSIPRSPASREQSPLTLRSSPDPTRPETQLLCRYSCRSVSVTRRSDYLPNLAFSVADNAVWKSSARRQALMATISAEIDASCAICGAPPWPECSHEGERLELAFNQAHARWSGMNIIRYASL